MRVRWRTMLRAAIALVMLLALAPPPVLSEAGAPGGAFTCDFGVSSEVPVDELAPAIERDRMYMAERPGMLFKHIPFVVDPLAGGVLSGGRYLFDTADNAAEYLRWMLEDFELGGVLFLDRPEFIEPDCHAWTVVGASSWGDIHTDEVALRTERWATPARDVSGSLARAWPSIEHEARERGLSAVWLLYQPREHLATIVAFSPPLAPIAPDLSFASLATAPTLGPAFDDAGWERTLDRTQWSLNIWFPFEPGDAGEPSIWRNSPPFPQPTTTDGVCEPSRGESHANAPEDCTPRCGDAIEDAGETWQQCPSDVRYDW